MSELRQSPAGEQDRSYDLWHKCFSASMYYQRGIVKHKFASVTLGKSVNVPPSDTYLNPFFLLGRQPK